MKREQSAWENFLETGRIDDYLSYCQKRKQEIYGAAGEDVGRATDDQWNRPAGLQNTRG